MNAEQQKLEDALQTVLDAITRWDSQLTIYGKEGGYGKGIWLGRKLLTVPQAAEALLASHKNSP